jgi:hypothetical protein
MPTDRSLGCLVGTILLNASIFTRLRYHRHAARRGGARARARCEICEDEVAACRREINDLFARLSSGVRPNRPSVLGLAFSRRGVEANGAGSVRTTYRNIRVVPSVIDLPRVPTAKVAIDVARNGLSTTPPKTPEILCFNPAQTCARCASPNDKPTSSLAAKKPSSSPTPPPPPPKMTLYDIIMENPRTILSRTSRARGRVGRPPPPSKKA